MRPQSSSPYTIAPLPLLSICNTCAPIVTEKMYILFLTQFVGRRFSIYVITFGGILKLPDCQRSYAMVIEILKLSVHLSVRQLVTEGKPPNM